MNKKFTNILFMLSLLTYTNSVFPQSVSDLDNLDQDYLESLPKSIQDDILDEMNKQKKESNKNLQKRPSSKLLNNELVREWEDFKSKKELEQKSERYGLKLFNTMQSSFMPLNEPNFGSDYVLDYGDIIKIYKYGREADMFEVEVGRDGAIFLPDIGNISIAGLNFDQASNLIKKTYENVFIGSDVFISLSEIRDINVLVTGNVEFPGIYTLSGNSNLLQALNIVGGVKENGSLRKIVIKRKGDQDRVIDLYEALIFGDIDSIPSLMSGDAIYVQSVGNLVRAGYGFDLGKKNRLSSVSYGGGDAGGGNATCTYSYTNFNELDVQDLNANGYIGFEVLKELNGATNTLTFPTGSLYGSAAATPPTTTTTTSAPT